MKKTTLILAAIITLSAVTAALLRIQQYGSDEFSTISGENAGLRSAMNVAHNHLSRDIQTINTLQTQLSALTNRSDKLPATNPPVSAPAPVS